MTTIGITVFPGTNNEHETRRALESFHGVDTEFIRHFEYEKVQEMDGIYIAGGFSYGDVLRAGAVAATTEVVEEVRAFIREDKPVIGICNGFQILAEAQLLNGALLPNTSTRFVCKFIRIRIEPTTSFLEDIAGEIIQLPVAHFEGNYWNHSVDDEIVAKYVDEHGNATRLANPNGSINSIAGISDTNNTIGLMPHPERAVFKFHGSIDGRKIIAAFLEATRC